MKNVRLAFATFLAIFAMSALASAHAATSCAAGNVILSAKMPGVDLYDGNGPSDSAAFVKTIDRAQFPACLPIVTQAQNSMLKVTLDGTSYWIAPNSVDFTYSGKGAAQNKPICANWHASAEDQTQAGSTRGLSNGCTGSKKSK